MSASRDPTSGTAPYRMGELARRSGVARETIHFYLREGLLPPPRRKSRNSAHYGDEHVERLRAIRALREERGLPLGVIRRLLDRQTPVASESDLSVLERILAMSPLRPEEAVGGPAAERALRRAGLGPVVLTRARALGLVSQTEIGPGDARVLEAIAEAAGGDAEVLDYTLEDMAVCVPHLERMVEDEARLFFRSLLADEVPARTLSALQGGRGAVARFISAYRAKLLYRLVEDAISGIGKAVRGAGTRTLPPLSATARRAGRHAQRVGKVGPPELARLHLGAGEPEALAALATAELRRAPGNPFFLAMLGAAHVDAGRPAAAVEPLEAAAFAAPAWGFARAWLGAAVLSSLGAPGSSIVADGARGIRLLDGALRAKGETADLVWVRWLAGTAFVTLPDVFGRKAEGMALLRRLAEVRVKATDLEGVRIHAGAKKILGE